MTYNMTPFEESRNIAENFNAINTISDNLLVTGGLITLFIVLTMALMRKNPPPESFTASSAVSTLVSLFFLALGWVGIEWVVGFGLIFAISAVALYQRNKTS